MKIETKEGCFFIEVGRESLGEKKIMILEDINILGS